MLQNNSPINSHYGVLMTFPHLFPVQDILQNQVSWQLVPDAYLSPEHCDSRSELIPLLAEMKDTVFLS